MKLSEMNPNKMVIENLFNAYPIRQHKQFSYDGKLQIQHSLDLSKLKLSIDESMAKFGRHAWQSASGSTYRYTGFSMTYNPDHQDDIDPNASTLGTPKNKQGEFFYQQTDNHTTLRNSYYDAYGFIKRTPAASLGYLSEILNSCKRTLIRSRMMILDGTKFDASLVEQYKNASVGDSKFGWHRDEPVNVNLRINIPVCGSDAFVFEMQDEPPYNLEPGFAYSWDTNIPHRVYCREQTEVQRYNLVIGVAPWFDFNPNTHEWSPNQYHGVKNPLDMVKEGLVFDWLKI